MPSKSSSTPRALLPPRTGAPILAAVESRRGAWQPGDPLGERATVMTPSSLRYARCMVTKSAPFSMRLPSATDELVTTEARRTRRSKGAVVAALAEEALRMRLVPGIAFRGDDYERRPWVIGTALDVWQVIEGLRDLGSVARLVAEADIEERHAKTAQAHYERFPDEIHEAIADNRRSIDELRRAFPTIDVIHVDA